MLLLSIPALPAENSNNTQFYKRYDLSITALVKTAIRIRRIIHKQQSIVPTITSEDKAGLAAVIIPRDAIIAARIASLVAELYRVAIIRRSAALEDIVD